MLVVGGQEALRTPHLIMLDKDGTLIDIHHYWTSMIRLRAAKIIETWFSGAEPSESQRIEALLVERMGVGADGRMKPDGPVGVQPRSAIARIVAETVGDSGMDVTPQAIEVEIFTAIDDQTEADLMPLLRLLPNVVEFLTRCHERGIRLAVVTTDVTRRAESALKVLGLRHLFDHVVGGDKVANSKPAPDLATQVLDMTGIAAENAAVIGDHPVDIHMGINSGIPCNIAVLTGISDREKFRGLPCWIVDSLEQLEVRDQ